MAQQTPSPLALQPLAWALDHPLPDSLRFIRGLRLPLPIQNTLASLRDIQTIPRYPPVSSLHDALAALAPEIIAFTPNYFNQEKPKHLPDVWFYTRLSESIHTNRLTNLIQAWLTACYGNDVANAAHKRWQEEGIHWGSGQIVDLATASEQLSRFVLPGILIRWLLANGYRLVLPTIEGERSFTMRLVPLMTLRNAAELMSEPEKASDDAWYSFVVRLWLERLPHSPSPCLLFRLSTRRWRSHPLLNGRFLDMQLNQNKSVYWRRTTGYLSDTAQEDVFARVHLRCVRYGESGLRWAGLQPIVLNQLNIRDALPDCVDLARQPISYFPDLLITAHQRDKDTHPIGIGAWSNDHRMAFEKLDALIGTIATRLPLVQRIETAAGKRRRLARSMERRRTALLALGEPLCIELYLDDSRTAREIILEEVGLLEQYRDQLTENPLEIRHNEKLVLRIVDMNIPLITASLTGHPENKKGWERASEERSKAIAALLPAADVATGALIMLRDYRGSYRLKHLDPKFAARWGLLATGRLSKFFEPRKSGERPNEKTDVFKVRMRNAVRALLGGLGYRNRPLYSPPKTRCLPETLDVLAFWLIQLNRSSNRKHMLTLPIVVEARFGEPYWRVSLPGSSTTARTYFSVREAIIAAQHINADFSNPERCLNFYRSVLDQTPRDRTALLLLPEQNLRRVFTELRDQSSEQVSFEGLLDEYPNLRVARLRSSADDEVPVCIPSIKRSKWQGLFTTPHPHIFYSLHSLQNRRINRDFTKLSTLRKPAGNPSTLQIWMQRLHPEDIPAEWGALVHRLRDASAHTDIATLIVQPLHDVLKVMHSYFPDVSAATDETDMDET
jgi:hypothetical protein